MSNAIGYVLRCPTSLWGFVDGVPWQTRTPRPCIAGVTVAPAHRVPNQQSRAGACSNDCSRPSNRINIYNTSKLVFWTMNNQRSSVKRISSLISIIRQHCVDRYDQRSRPNTSLVLKEGSKEGLAVATHFFKLFQANKTYPLLLTELTDWNRWRRLLNTWRWYI